MFACPLSALPPCPWPELLGKKKNTKRKNETDEGTKCRGGAKAAHLNNTDPAGEKEVSVISAEAREGTGPD